MRHADFAGPGNGPATDKAGIRYRVMWRAEGTSCYQTAFGRQYARDGMDSCGFQTLRKGHRRQNRRDTFGEHGFSGSGTADKQHVVSAGHCDFDCAFGMELTTDVTEIFSTALRFLMVGMQIVADRIDQTGSIDKLDDFGVGSNRIHGNAGDDG